jgi:hypothetical protein
MVASAATSASTAVAIVIVCRSVERVYACVCE